MNENQHEFVPAGHYFSVIPDKDYIESKKNTLFDRTIKELPGINLNDVVQNEWFQKMVSFYNDIPFQDTKKDGLRYYFQNNAYGYNDAIMLYTFIRGLEPKNIIEVGSGFSSAVILDTVEKFLDKKTQVTFIEPFPHALNQTISPSDFKNNTFKQSFVQDVPISFFQSLKENDILFIDSTHVSKIGSDVNYLYFEILPLLNPGVYVHIHDIFFPFEYPEAWIKEGRYWNEDYLVRAFLTFNDTYEIVFFNHYYHEKNKSLYEKAPLCTKNSGGSLWLRKKK